MESYIAIDLKSFYASVECVERGLDPLTTNLVVADNSRTEKTICLAVTPALKAYGIPGRARLFEVVEQVEKINARRRQTAPGRQLTGKSTDAIALAQHPELALDYIVATPRMARYMAVSAGIYQIYLRHIAPEDIHVYSVDEVFIRATPYLTTYRMTPHQLAQRLISEVFRETHITATAGIGPNLYLCKVAMDIWAKHIPADENGVRIAELTEESYRAHLWSHRPLTDFWRVGHGYQKKLEAYGMYTMGDIARCSLGRETDFHNEALLRQLFGVQAELLIDHAWGYEPCTIEAIKAYHPQSTSLGSGQVLQHAYSASKARLIVREMADALSLDLVEKGLQTDRLVLTVGYDTDSLKKEPNYRGKITVDHYGRRGPKHAHGTASLPGYTASSRQILGAVTELYDRITDDRLLIRRLNLAAGHILTDRQVADRRPVEQLDLFTDFHLSKHQQDADAHREKRMQEAVLEIKRKYGKNAILKGSSFLDGATARERNRQIGGHKA